MTIDARCKNTSKLLGDVPFLQLFGGPGVGSTMYEILTDSKDRKGRFAGDPAAQHEIQTWINALRETPQIMYRDLFTKPIAGWPGGETTDNTRVFLVLTSNASSKCFAMPHKYHMESDVPNADKMLELMNAIVNDDGAKYWPKLGSLTPDDLNTHVNYNMTQDQILRYAREYGLFVELSVEGAAEDCEGADMKERSALPRGVNNKCAEFDLANAEWKCVAHSGKHCVIDPATGLPTAGSDKCNLI